MLERYNKVRIGITMSGWPFPDGDPKHLKNYVSEMESLDIDSLWFTDRIVSPLLSLESVVAMSFVAAWTERLKIGTSVIALPLRNPTVLSKEIATIDFLSGGRCLPAVGLGTEDELEYEACGTKKKTRVSRTEEAIEIMRLLWSEDDITYHGKHFTLNGVTVTPKPIQKNLPPIWLGGRSPAAIERTARIGDGWLVSSATVDEISAGVSKIKEKAPEYNNDIEDDHYGALFNYCIADTKSEAIELGKPWTPLRRQDVNIENLHAFGPPDVLINMIEEHIDAGITKFTLRPSCPPEMNYEQMKILGHEIIPKFHKQEQN